MNLWPLSLTRTQKHFCARSGPWKKPRGKKYHCAAGTAWSPAPFSAYGLIKTAERNMYASKQRYYSGKTDRRKART